MRAQGKRDKKGRNTVEYKQSEICMKGRKIKTRWGRRAGALGEDRGEQKRKSVSQINFR